MTIIRTAHLLASLVAAVVVASGGCKQKQKTPAETAPTTESAPPTMDAAGSAAVSAEPAPVPSEVSLGACTIKAEHSCHESKFSEPAHAATKAKQCADISKGTWTVGPCPMENAIGECTNAAGRFVYYKGAQDPKDACEMMIFRGTYLGGGYTPL